MGLALSWPRPLGTPSLIVEADPAGGVIGPRYGLVAEPTLASWASDVRRGFSIEGLISSCQHVTDDVVALISPADLTTTERALDRSAGVLAAGLVELDANPANPVFSDIIVDLGRLRPASPTSALARAADVVVLMVRPRLEEVSAGVGRARALLALGCNVELVCVGDEPHDPHEVALALGLPLLGVVADAPQHAGLLNARTGVDKRLRRSLWWRSIAHLALGLSARDTPVSVHDQELVLR